MKLRRFDDALIACNRGIEIDASDPKLRQAKTSILRAMGNAEL